MMRLRIILLACLFAAAAPGEALGKKTKLAVLGIEPVDMGSAASQKATATVAKWLTDGLRERASRARNRYEIAPNSRKELTEMKLLENCWEESTDCMAKIGQVLGADHLMFGKLEKKKDGYTLSLKLLDVSAQSFLKQKADTFSAEGVTQAQMEALAGEFFESMTGLVSGGTLVVEANVRTGTVFIDGEPRAALAGGVARIEGIKAGKVAVTVEAPGHQTWEGEATISEGATERLSASLSPAEEDGDGIGGPEKPGDSRSGYRIATWTTAVITAGGLTAMTITGLKVRSIEDEKHDLIVASRSNANPNERILSQSNDNACAEAEMKNYQPVVEKCDEGQKLALITNGLIAVNVVAGLATLYFAYKGYMQGDPTTGPERTARKKKDQTRVQLMPEIYPQGAGVGAVIQF